MEKGKRNRMTLGHYYELKDFDGAWNPFEGPTEKVGRLEGWNFWATRGTNHLSNMLGDRYQTRPRAGNLYS